MALEIDRIRREPKLSPASQPLDVEATPAAREDPVLIAATADSADLIGVGDEMSPLVELCLSPQAQTPFRVGLIGPFGSGKTFALRRLIEAIDLGAANAASAPQPRLAKVVVATFDAAGLGAERAGFDPASALASAAFAALEQDRGGMNYGLLADEAAYGAADPRRAAAAAAERHDEVSRRLEAERAARDDLESKRARMAEWLIYETPGSRVDTMIRANRASIEARLRRFGFGDGDAAANYRDLLRDLAGASAGSRVGLALRATWAYRGQRGLLLLAIVAGLVALALTWLKQASVDGTVRSLGSAFGAVADFLAQHIDWLQHGVQILIAIAILALVVDAWRAASFSTLMFRGLRLLNLDIRERKRELDASAARLARRVAMLTAEAEAAGKHAETLARRAGGGVSVSHARAPGPPFLRALDAPAKAAREFFAELARLMSQPLSPDAPSPSRLIIAIDNLEALASAEALRVIDLAQSLLGAGAAALIACDPAALAPSDPAAFALRRFDVVFNLGALGASDSERLAARLIAERAGASPRAPLRSERPPLNDPLSPAEIGLIAALAPLSEGTPGAIKRLHNAYRLARLAAAPRPLVALMVAALQSPDRQCAPALALALAGEGEWLEEPAAPARLAAAFQAARGALGGPIARADALAAWNAARLWAPTERA